MSDSIKVDGMPVILSEYKRCLSCGLPMIGIMKQSGHCAPRVVCEPCGGLSVGESENV